MRKYLIIFIAFALVGALLVRLWLPGFVESHINRTLASLDGYDGEVKEVDLALWMGRARVQGFEMHKRSSEIDLPFIEIPSLDVALQWRGLLRGELIAEIAIERPVLWFIDGATEESSQYGLGPSWSDRLDALLPFRINALTVHDGQIEFHANGAEQPQAPLAILRNVKVTATNFTNITKKAAALHASISASGTLQKTSQVKVDVQIDPLSNPPELTVDASVERLPLAELNMLLRKYANIDAESGTFEAYVEFASADGQFEGYIKPLLMDAEFFRVTEKGSFFGKAWQALVDATNSILENDQTDRSGARIPLSGELREVNAELIPAIFSVLRNAFVEALSASLTDSININSVEKPSTETSEPEAV